MNNLIAAFTDLSRYFRSCRSAGWDAQPAYEEHRLAGLRMAGFDVSRFYALVVITDPRYAGC